MTDTIMEKEFIKIINRSTFSLETIRHHQLGLEFCGSLIELVASIVNCNSEQIELEIYDEKLEQYTYHYIEWSIGDNVLYIKDSDC